MFTVCVRDHVMVAHSFEGELFGPAQRLHGATFVVDLELRRAELDANGVVVDIARAAEALGKVLNSYRYRNLDELPELRGRNTTTEVMAQEIFKGMVAQRDGGALGPGSEALCSMKVTLHESHVAWASYEGSF